MYGVGAATAGLGCGAQGAGGGLCMSGAAAATIQANSLTGNKGSTGGALFASADCEAVAGGCRAGQVNVTDLTARDNSATEAGGVLYTTTPAAVNVGDAGKDPASAEQRRQQIVQQLSESNTVGQDGYGPAVASFPTTLSLMHTAQDEEGVVAPQPKATEQAVLQQQQQGQQQPKQGSSGRRLQQLPLPPGNDIAAAVSSATADIKQQVNSTYRTTSAPTAATSDTLQPFCPALGASITAQHAMAVGANQNFSLPVSVLDAFGSQARRGPGSDWIVALSQNSGGARTLSGNMRGALSGGYVVLQGLSIQAEPGSRLNLTLSAVPPPGSGDKPLSATIDVLVRPCLAGEYATVSSEPGQASSSVSCRTCAAPTFSFSAYPPPGAAAAAAASEKDICQSCPERGICVAGMVIPESGAFQVHPRSTVIRRCPNVRACQRNATATLNLQGLQCANRRYIDPADIDPRPYTAMQCSPGYAGPFCSSCYRPGRNLWLLQQLERAGSPQQGFTLGDQVVLASGRAGVTARRGEVYGKASGRCRRCPHLAAAWLGFLLSRLLDLLVIGCMAALWLLYGWLSHSAAATASVQLKHQRMASLKMRDSIFGSALSMKGGLQAAPTLSEAYFSAASSNASAARSATLSREMQREMRHQPSSMRVRESAARQASGPPMEHAHLQLQASVTQPLGTGPGALMKLPNGSRMTPPAAAGVAPAYTSPFSLVDQQSVQPMLVSEPSGSSLQGAASRVFSGGLYHIYRPASMRWSSAVSVVDLLRQQYMHGHGSSPASMSQQGSGDDVLGQQAALLLMAVKHLACLAQVLLDAAQVAAVLLSLDLVLLVPDWAAQGLAGVLLTQAHTWQYVPFECLIPGGSQASAAVAQTVAVMLLPIIYTLVLSPMLLWLVDLSKDSALFRQHVLARAAAPAVSKDTAAQAAAAPAGARRGCSWLSRFWPVKSGTWTLFVAVAVASMAYCYSFYVATLTGAFNCMSLSTRQGVPGEQQVTRSVWVPDMQLSCSSPPQLAAMAAAILIGIPLLVGYWLLLLTLAWPKQPASPAPVAACKASSRLLRALASYWALLKRACLLPFTWLERPVRTCQRLTSALGVSGESCATLSVWNVEWRWWWLAGREAAKFGLVAAAALTTMRGPDEQARVLLLLVVIAAALSWRVQAGCSTSMNQLQFLAWCWLQLLALLVVVPSMQDISVAGFGAALLALVALVMLQCGVVIGCLVWRIVASLKNLSLLMALEAEGGGALPFTGVAS
uniref:TRP C-terminal domain-containing protein n=1 Tax=Tetradesmus obliquus TaxID=3088 RepID=A0A383VEU3_TETOB|eukprot:jgi/Sobl393_1/6834/SZX62896.1